MHMPVQRRLLILAGSLILLLSSACVRVVLYDKAKEKALRQDLFTLRQAIDQYTLDKQKVPGSLEDLVKAGYLKSIPIDPFTGRRDWVIDNEPETQDPPPPGQIIRR
jgi:general secretion pathway protein G